MTVQNTNTKNIYVGNGSTTVFPFTFYAIKDKPEYLKVYITGTDGVDVLTDNYTIDMDAQNVTYPKNGSPLKQGEKITITRELPFLQDLNLVNQGSFFAEEIEKAFDRDVMLLQQIYERIGRTLAMGISVDVNEFNPVIPLVPGMSFRVNDAGTALESTEDPARVLPLARAALADTKYAQKQAIEAKNQAVSAASLTKLQGIWFETVLDMKRADLAEGLVVNTKGYSKPLDGGKATYLVKSKGSQDENGTVISLDNGNVAVMEITDSVNVLALGAVADGITDDVKAFEVASKLGVKVIVPSGNYYLSKPVFYAGDCENKGTYTNYSFISKTSKVLLKNIRNLQEEFVVNYDTSYVQQGATYNTKNKKIILAVIKQDNSAQKIMIVDPVNYTIENSYEFADLGHCNTLSYCEADNRIYVTTLENNTIAVLDADTMALVDTFTLEYTAVSYLYDNVNRIFIAVTGLGFESGEFITAYFYDRNKTLLKTEQYAKPYPYMIANGGVAYDGQLIVLSHSGYACCDYFGNVLNFVKINRNTEGVLAIMETEDCYIIDGVCYTAYIGSYGGATEVFRHNLMGEVGNLDNRVTYYRYNDTDLDNCVRAGRYFVNNTGDAGSLNYPLESRSGFLDVYVLGGTEDEPQICKQIFRQIGTYYDNEFVRTKENGLWTKWAPTSKIKSGRVNFEETENVELISEYYVAFNEPFTNIPEVVATLIYAGGDVTFYKTQLSVHSVTKTGFYLKIYNESVYYKNIAVYWIASNNKG